MQRIIAYTLVFCFLVSAAPSMARTLRQPTPTPEATRCDALGPGFVRIEGSDTCIHLSGNVRAEFTTSRGGGGSPALDGR